MCEDAGDPGNKTNHSLRATGASALFQAGVPEQVIQERTGHMSVAGLRHYERVTDTQHKEACKILSSSSVSSSSSSFSARSSVSTSIGSAPVYTFSGCTVHVCSDLFCTSKKTKER